jgi:hypothetical protein
MSATASSDNLPPLRAAFSSNVVPVNVFHDQIVAVLFAEIVVNTGYVRIVEPGEHFRLAVKSHRSFALHARIGEGIEHLCQRTSPICKAEIFRKVNLLHSSAAQGPHESIAATYDAVNHEHDGTDLFL